MDPDIQQMLDQLRDLHSPPGVGWWPPAPGWWILAALLLAAVVLGLLLLRRRHLLSAYKRDALELLQKAYAEFEHNADGNQFLASAAQIMRRLLLYRQGRKEVAQLSGQQWRELLQKAAEDKLTEASLDALVVQQYRREPEFDGKVLYRDLQQFIATLEPSPRV